MSKELTITHMARGVSDLYHVLARKQYILCFALLYRFEIFSALETIVDGSIRCRRPLTYMQPRVFARLLVGKNASIRHTRGT